MLKVKTSFYFNFKNTYLGIIVFTISSEIIWLNGDVIIDFDPLILECSCILTRNWHIKVDIFFKKINIH